MSPSVLRQPRRTSSAPSYHGATAHTDSTAAAGDESLPVRENGPTNVPDSLPKSQRSVLPQSHAPRSPLDKYESLTLDPVFGIQGDSARPQKTSHTAKYEDESKYPPDPHYHELDDEARVWRVYLDEAKAYDADVVGEARESLDVLLIFAALFSAVLTTFVVQTSQSLSQNVADVSVIAPLVVELTQLVRAIGNGTSVDDVHTTPAGQENSRTPTIIWVNGLWFVSLTLSLSTAVLAVMAKQWIRQYMLSISGTSRERCHIRQFRYDGLKRWRFQLIIALLPIPLHLSLIFFLIGLVIFLVPLHVGIAGAVASVTFLLFCLYIATTALPLVYVDCPFRTPFSAILYHASICATLLWGRIRDTMNSQVAIARETEMDDKEPTPRTLRDLERYHALKDDIHGGIKGKRILTSLQWLFRNTSYNSARSIIRQSLGALPYEPPESDLSIMRTRLFGNEGWLRADLNLDVQKSVVNLAPAEVDTAAKLLRAILILNAGTRLKAGAVLHDPKREYLVLFLVAGARVRIGTQRVELKTFLDDYLHGHRSATMDTALVEAALTLPYGAWQLVCAAFPRKKGIPAFLHGRRVLMLICDLVLDRVETRLKEVSDDKLAQFRVIAKQLDPQSSFMDIPSEKVTLKEFLSHDLGVLRGLLRHALEPDRWSYTDDDDSLLSVRIQLLLDINQYLLSNLEEVSKTPSRIQKLWTIIQAYAKGSTSDFENQAISISIHRLAERFHIDKTTLEPPPYLLSAFNVAFGTYDVIASSDSYPILTPPTPLVLRIAVQRDQFHPVLSFAMGAGIVDSYKFFFRAADTDSGFRPIEFPTPRSQRACKRITTFAIQFVRGIARIYQENKLDPEFPEFELDSFYDWASWIYDHERFIRLIKAANSADTTGEMANTLASGILSLGYQDTSWHRTQLEELGRTDEIELWDALNIEPDTHASVMQAKATRRSYRTENLQQCNGNLNSHDEKKVLSSGQGRHVIPRWLSLAPVFRHLHKSTIASAEEGQNGQECRPDIDRI